MAKVFRWDTGYKKKSIVKRRSLSKDERVLIAHKTNFKCGYCGEDLGKSFVIDHIKAFVKSQSCTSENLMATCFQCNSFKSSFTVEEFRVEVSKQVERARKYSVNFRMAENFGLIEARRVKIIFYFEKLGG